MIVPVFFAVPNGNEHTVVRREELEELTEAQFKELSQEAEAGNAEAQLLLGYYCSAEAEKKLELFQNLPSGSPFMRAPYCMGDRNPITDAVNEDRHAAFEWFEKAAAQGKIEAVYALSICYNRGEGIASYPEKARELLQRAANAGYMPAQYDWGMLLLYGDNNPAHGDEIKKDEPLAVEWLKKAAVQGDSLAQYQLGVCFEEGVGVEKDMEQAIAYYKESAERGNELALMALEALEED